MISSTVYNLQTSEGNGAFKSLFKGRQKKMNQAQKKIVDLNPNVSQKILNLQV